MNVFKLFHVTVRQRDLKVMKWNPDCFMTTAAKQNATICHQRLYIISMNQWCQPMHT